MAGRQSFAVLEERPLAALVVLGRWCPSMDLLALVTDDGQLTVHRLDWHKLWLACPGVAVTMMCWRPDGGWRGGVGRVGPGGDTGGDEGGAIGWGKNKKT